MKRRTSHGHAMRSIFGRSRVTQRVAGVNGSVSPPAARHARDRLRDTARRSRARAARPPRPGSLHGRARNRRPPGARARASRPARRRLPAGSRTAPGMITGFASKAGCRRTSTSCGGGNAASAKQRKLGNRDRGGRIHVVASCAAWGPRRSAQNLDERSSMRRGVCEGPADDAMHPRQIKPSSNCTSTARRRRSCRRRWQAR